MALVLNEDQLMLRDAAAGFLREKAGVAALRRLRDGAEAAGFSRALWRQIVDMGWAGMAIPEEFGGLGYGYTGLGLVLEQAGRNLSVSPLQATVLAGATLVNLLGSPAQKERLLPAIAAGETLLALALQEGPQHAPLQTALPARAEDGEFVLEGEKQLVLDAPVADVFVVIARTAGQPGEAAGLGAFLVEAGAAGVAVEPRSLVDSRPAGVLRLRGARVDAEAVLGEPGAAWAGLERALDIANAGLAAELLGLSCEAFERTLAYLRERRQFGRPIGAFQGLQHRAAELFAELELGRSLVLQALQAADAGDERLSLLASAAKAKLCEVASRATNEAIQMHGGIGMTDEHDIGLFIKRARVAQHWLGDYNYQLDRFARLSGF